MQQSANNQILIPGLGLVDSQSATTNNSASGVVRPLPANFTEGPSTIVDPANHATGWRQPERIHTNLSFAEHEIRGGAYPNANVIHHQEISFGGDDIGRRSRFVTNSAIDISPRKPPPPPLPPPRTSPPVLHEGQSGHFLEGSHFRQGYPAAPPLPPGPRPKEVRVGEIQNEWVDPTKYIADSSKELTSKSGSVDRRPRRKEAGSIESEKSLTMSPYLAIWDGSKMDADGQFFEAYCDRDIDKAMFSSRAAILKKNLNTAKSSITKKQPRSGPMKISLKKSKKR